MLFWLGDTHKTGNKESHILNAVLSPSAYVFWSTIKQNLPDIHIQTNSRQKQPSNRADYSQRAPIPRHERGLARCTCSIWSLVSRHLSTYSSRRITVAGTPPATHPGWISLVTIAPAAIVVPFPICTPGRIVALAPIQQSDSIIIGSANDVPSFSCRDLASIAWVPVQMQTPGPIRTRSPIWTRELS